MKKHPAFPRPARRQSCWLLAIITALAWSLPAAANDEPLTEEQKIIHVLNRLGYGPRPGDVERVKKIGLDAYLQQQLHPEKMAVAALEQKLAGLKTLQLSSDALMEEFTAELRQAIERQREMGDNAAPRRPSREEMMQPRPARQAVGELQTAKIIRAVESEQQLYEVLVDFWANHFNVDVKKNAVRVLKVVDEREVIRPHVLGTFRDLLGASAHSPAMLVYLDNVLNSAPREVSAAEQRGRAQRQQRLTGQVQNQEMVRAVRPVREGGLNENYGRELLELHTLGVDGGYTQQDVGEVSRCFTGWGMSFGRFQFSAFRHDQGEKTVLGHNIPANGGQRDGEMVLDILARHPSTAKFISHKLCQRLVADEPPAALVMRVAKVFTETDGDLRRVVEAIITSPEFFSPVAFRAKIKSPFEYAVSSVRALGGRIVNPDNSNAKLTQMRYTMEGAASTGFGGGGNRMAGARRKSLNLHIFEMGQPLYSYQAPTGWPEDSRKWVSSGALISRLNFALSLTASEIMDVPVPQRGLLTGVDVDDTEAVLRQLEQTLVPAGLSPATRATLRQQLPGQQDGAATANVPQLVALVLGSPEFQRR